MIYILFSLIGSIGAILLILGFWNNFKNLKLIQKLGIFLVIIGTFLPFIYNFINGFVNGLINS